jgi:hypothetical protein
VVTLEGTNKGGRKMENKGKRKEKRKKEREINEIERKTERNDSSTSRQCYIPQ